MIIMASITFSGQINVDRAFQAIADIIAAREGVKVTVEVRRRNGRKKEVAG